MAKHEVTMQGPSLEVGKADVVFVVKRDNKAFGTLLVSRGAVEWRPKGKSIKTYKLKWDEVQKLFKKYSK